MTPDTNGLAAEYRRRFGTDPDLFLYAPYRGILVGPFADKFGLGFALEQGIFAALGFRDDHRYQFESIREQAVSHHGLPNPMVSFGWADPLFGMLRAFCSMGAKLSGLNLLCNSTLPPMPGLGTRSALAALLAVGINNRLQVGLHQIQLAILARSAESRELEAPVYMIDPAIVFCGRQGQIVALDYTEQKVFHLRSTASILVAHCGSDAQIPLPEQCLRASELELAQHQLAQFLGRRPSSLGEVTSEQLRQAELSARLERRILYVLEENRRTEAAIAALADGDLPALGRLMNESQAALRAEFEIAVPERNALLDWLMSRPEVFGANAAGNGGFVTALIRPEAEEQVLGALHNEYYPRLGLAQSPLAFFSAAGVGAQSIPVSRR